MNDINRVQEAIKQVRLAKQKKENSAVSQDLEKAIETLENAVESLEEEEKINNSSQ